jgi:hypothetical protein
MTISKVKFGDKVASSSRFLDRSKALTPLSNAKLGLKASVSPRLRSSDAASHTLQPKNSLGLSRFRGVWAGFLTQPDFSSAYPDWAWGYKMALNSTGGKNFAGKSMIYSPLSSSLYGIMSLRGRVVDGSLLFKEIQIIEQYPIPGYDWCLKGGLLKVSVSNSRLVLRGPWSSFNCGSGRIQLQKQ